MILVGRYLSPFVRRTAITMKLYGLPFEQNALSTATQPEEIRKVNPVGRVPALIADDGMTLVESGAIIDWLDEQVGPAKALTPPMGPERHRVQQIVVRATGTMDKAVAFSYETKRRPAERQHQPWIDNLKAQVASGLAHLEAIEGTPWLAGKSMTQADVTTAVMVDFLAFQTPELFAKGSHPRLEALAAKMGEMPAFKETALPGV